MAHLEVKITPGGRLLARRRDGRRLTPEDREEARRISQAEHPKYGIALDDVWSTFFAEEERTGWLCLEVQRPEKYPLGPIAIDPWQSITDAEKFAEATIQDLLTYIVAKNRGSGHHWVKRLLDEKLERLQRCGVKVQIRAIH